MESGRVAVPVLMVKEVLPLVDIIKKILVIQVSETRRTLLSLALG